jgi:hypothetical protein
MSQNKKLNPVQIAVLPILLSVGVAHADVIWPALYVVDSHFRFWYVIIAGLLLEAAVLRWRIVLNIKQALLVSLVVNAFSATVGIYLLSFGMFGLHIITDNLTGGTFSLFNKIATLVLMLIGSSCLEMLVARVVWKYPLRKTFAVFIFGNTLSYGFIVADLFIFGGWNKQF